MRYNLLTQIAIYSVPDRMRYDINPPMPAGISLAAGEYRARSVYRKSTKWIYIVEKGLAKASPFSGGDEGARTHDLTDVNRAL